MDARPAESRSRDCPGFGEQYGLPDTARPRKQGRPWSSAVERCDFDCLAQILKYRLAASKLLGGLVETRAIWVLNTAHGQQSSVV